MSFKRVINCHTEHVCQEGCPNILVGGAQPLEGPLNNISVTSIAGKNPGSIN